MSDKLVGGARLMESHPDGEPRKPHLRPVWIVLILLLPCLALTVYFFQTVVPSGHESDSFLPSTGYAFVLLAGQSGPHRVCRSHAAALPQSDQGLFRAPAPPGRIRISGEAGRCLYRVFALIPTVLLALVASGLVNKAVDVWFNDQIEHVMKDSYEVARMHHAGHVTLAINSARAISHEIFREDLLSARAAGSPGRGDGPKAIGIRGGRASKSFHPRWKR